jgi:hypothetical protein
MRPLRLAFALGLLLLSSGSAASAEGARGPGDSYREIAAVVREASGWDAILPLLSASYRKDVESQDAEGRQAFLAYFKGSLDQSDLAIISEQIDGDSAVLEARGKSAGGKESTGRIEMVREGGLWKLQEYGWASPD